MFFHRFCFTDTTSLRVQKLQDKHHLLACGFTDTTSLRVQKLAALRLIKRVGFTDTTSLRVQKPTFI